MKNALNEKETNKVLVHCAAGRSRSGAFIAAYMIKFHRMTLEDCLAEGQKKRWKFYPNLNFQEQLVYFQLSCHGMN